MKKKFFLTFISLIIILIFWNYLGSKTIIQNNSLEIPYKINCISYAPFGKNESPKNLSNGLKLNEKNIKKDLEILSQYTKCIRTYSTIGLESIPKIAQELDMKVIMGAWIGKDDKKSQQEIDALIELAEKYSDTIKSVMIGNEVLLRNDTSEEKLRNYILYVKKRLPNTKVSYADVFEYWIDNQNLKNITDFVTIHILPYWEDNPQNIQNSIKFVENIRIKAEERLGTKNIFIGETGWPSEGRTRKDATPSKINQATFIQNFIQLANEKNWDYNIIEGFDQPWKKINEGAVGGYWGLFDKNRENKNILSNSVSNFPNYIYLALGSLFFLLIFSYKMLNNKNIPINKIFIFQITNIVFSILIMLQINQYLIINRNYFEIIFEIIILTIQIYMYYIMLSNILKDKQFIEFPKITFYVSIFIAFVLTTNLSFHGRYENFEIYGFLILGISFLWFYFMSNKNFVFTKFERLLAIFFIANLIILFINESIFNISSNIWIITCLIFLFILNNLTDKKIIFENIKEIFSYSIIFISIVYIFKIGFVSNSHLINYCNNHSSTSICFINSSMNYFIYFGYIGYVAFISSILSLILKNEKICFIGLFFSLASITLTNTFLGSISLIIVSFTITQEHIKSKKYIKD